MTVQYVSVEDAIQRGGLRMVVVGGVPSPWGEAAKGTGPVAVYEDERPRDGWAEILLLAERLAPTPSLLPADAAERALVFGLAHEICGEVGLGWSRRLQLVHAGLHGAGGFPERVAKYLGKKYGYSPELGAASGARVAELVGMLVARLKAQRQT